MLDERDIQVIASLLDKQKKEIREDFMTVIDNEVTKNLRTLAEGHEIIIEKMIPESRIEALESDIIVLKAAVKHLSEKLQALEKAL